MSQEIERIPPPDQCSDSVLREAYWQWWMQQEMQKILSSLWWICPAEPIADEPTIVEGRP